MVNIYEFIRKKHFDNRNFTQVLPGDVIYCQPKNKPIEELEVIDVKKEPNGIRLDLCNPITNSQRHPLIKDIYTSVYKTKLNIIFALYKQDLE